MVFISGELSINLADFEVRRGGEALRLEPLTLELLSYLVRNRGRLITKDELFERVWKGAFVSEAALTQAVAVLRRLFADDGRAQKVIETVRGKGYRFIGPLHQAASTGGLGEDESGGVSPSPTKRAPTPFVGRHRLMRELDLALEEAVGGRGSLILLHGEPGCGKTRASDELGRTARGRGVRTFSVGALAVASGQAYWPWVQMLEALRASGLGDESGAENRIDAALDVLQPAGNGTAARLETASAGAADSHRLEILERVADALRRVTSYTPVVLIFDDVHDADIASMRLLDFVGRTVGQMSALVVATYREVEARTPRTRAELLGGMVRLARTRDEPLRGLTRIESGRLFEALTGKTVDGAALDSLYQRTAGNPFFLHQLARLEASAPAAPRSGEDGAPAALPARVIDSVTQHLTNLSEGCRATLTALAIFGLEARVPLLTATRDRAPREILQDLSEAVAAGVLHEANGRYRFVHALIAEALNGALEPKERARLHLRAAAALASSGSASDAEVAHHFYLARAVGGAARCGLP